MGQTYVLYTRKEYPLGCYGGHGIDLEMRETHNKHAEDTKTRIRHRCLQHHFRNCFEKGKERDSKEDPDGSECGCPKALLWSTPLHSEGIRGWRPKLFENVYTNGQL